MASGQGAGTQPGTHVILAGRSGQMVQASASSRQAGSSHQCLHDEQRTGIDVFVASGEQVAEHTVITANRAGQIGNDVIKMCAGGQRKAFVPVQRRSKVIARLCEKNVGIRLGAQHNTAALFAVKASRFRRWFGRSSFQRALAAYEYITDSSTPPVTTASASQGRLHRRNGKIAKFKATFLDILRARRYNENKN